MKQVIFLNFYCQIYKKAPTARIYVGNTLIDEIEIPEHVDKTFEEKLNKKHIFKNEFDSYFGRFFSIELSSILDPVYNKKKLNPISMNSFEEYCNIEEKITYPKTFVYVVDDEILKTAGGNVSIEIKNNDSNYNNGFMTKSTLLNIAGFYVIPEIFVNNAIKITQRHENFWGKNNHTDLKKIFKFYVTSRNTFPTNLIFCLKRKLANNQEEDNSLLYPIGGDCQFIFKLKRKYHVWWPDYTTHQARFPHMDAWKRILNKKGYFHLDHAFIKHFLVNGLNKYKQNENQRDTD